MKKIRFITLFIAITAISSFLSVKVSAYGLYDNAADFIDSCTVTNEDDVFQQILEVHCLGYLSGFLDSLQLIFTFRPSSALFCPSATGLSSENIRNIVKEYIKNDPEGKSDTPRMAVLLALGRKFPC